MFATHAGSIDAGIKGAWDKLNPQVEMVQITPRKSPYEKK